MKSLGKRIGAVALVLAAAFVAQTSAQAAIVTGKWDPALPNPPFNGLGWTSTINFSVPQDCLDSTAGFKINLFGHSFGCKTNPFAATPAITVLSAQAGIYDLGTHTLQDVLTFDPASLVLFLVQIDVNGELTYFVSFNPSNAVQGGIAADDSYDFRLTLNGPTPGIQYSLTGTNQFSTASAPSTETAFVTTPGDDPQTQQTVIENTKLKVGDLVFDVPEPASLPLAMLALTGVWALRRRR